MDRAAGRKARGDANPMLAPVVGMAMLRGMIKVSFVLLELLHSHLSRRFARSSGD
jgi:hypothetical protein